MNKTIIAFIGGAIIIFAIGWGIIKANSPKAIVARQVAERAQLERVHIYSVKAGNKLGEQMEYFMDSRPTPPQCFGYLWIGGGQGGPAIANVPCEAVKELIKNGVNQTSW